MRYLFLYPVDICLRIRNNPPKEKGFTSKVETLKPDSIASTITKYHVENVAVIHCSGSN